MSTIDHNSHEIATIISQVATHEATQLGEIWQQTLSGRDHVLLYAEYTAILLSFADRLAACSMPDAQRARLLGPTLRELEDAFTRQNNFGTAEPDRRGFYRDLMHQRLDDYGHCLSIMGEDENQVVFTGAVSLIDRFLPETNSSEKGRLVLET